MRIPADARGARCPGLIGSCCFHRLNDEQPLLLFERADFLRQRRRRSIASFSRLSRGLQVGWQIRESHCPPMAIMQA